MRPLTLAALVALAAPLTAAPPAQEGRGRSTEGPDQRVQLDFQHYYTLREVEVALNTLAAAYPEFLRLESMGKSPDGHELWILTATRFGEVDAGDKPALLVASGLGEHDLWGTEMALFTALRLVEENARDAQVASVLDEVVIYFAPCLNPDLRDRVFAEEGGDSSVEPRVDLDANFEIGWRPELGRAGPYPLSEPETVKLAKFLLKRPNVAVVQTYRGRVENGSPAGIPEVPAADLLVFDRVIAIESRGQRDGGALRGLPDLATDGGTLLEFAYGHRGAFGFVTLVGGAGPDAPEVFELFPLGRRAWHATMSLAAALPHLELEVAGRTRLKGDLWEVDLAVRNAGTLPTLSALGQLRFACGPPRLSTSGAELSAAAVRRHPQGVFEVAESSEGALVLDQIPGGGSQTVRLIVQAEEGTTLDFTLGCPRAGTATAAVELR